MIERITGMIAVVKSERQGRRSIQSVNHRFFKRWFGAPLGASMVGWDAAVTARKPYFLNRFW